MHERQETKSRISSIHLHLIGGWQTPLALPHVSRVEYLNEDKADHAIPISRIVLLRRQ
jgi:hypothetical protein